MSRSLVGQRTRGISRMGRLIVSPAPLRWNTSVACIQHPGSMYEKEQ